jgi:hypothetical protein
MNISRPKEHRAWRPRMSSDHEFNPFTSAAGFEASSDRRTFEEMDEARQESGARADEDEPIKGEPPS